MNTLYISDLDGTLLNKNAELTDFTVKTLNKVIEKGLNFSIATARTQATVVQMMKNVNLNVPIILMNGVAIYDISQSKYINIERISIEGKKVLFDTIKKHIKSGFVYSIDNDELSTYYENSDSPNAKKFILEREQKYGKKFIKVDSFSDCIDKNIVYFSIENKKEKLETAYNILSNCSHLSVEFYRDIYNTDHWYLEVCSVNASKKNAVTKLKKICNFDYVISFGDNINDLPMFEVSDESYAVFNAKDDVKQKATAVIEKNTDDAVAKFLDKIDM